MLNEIVEDVFIWHWFSEPHGYNFNGYLIRSGDGNLCIDPAALSPDDLSEVVRHGVARILLTNRNHVRDSNRVRARTGARAAIHPADAAHARGQGAELDDDLQIGERIGPLTVLAAPGKSPGETVLHWPDRRLLIVGDCVIGNPPGSCSLLRPEVMDEPPRLKQSVRQLLDVDFDGLLVGDGEPILQGAKDSLRLLVDTF